MDQQGEMGTGIGGAAPAGASGASGASGAIVTPEGVVLDFWIAGLGSRAISFALDFAVRVIFFLVVAVIAAVVGGSSSVVGIIILLFGMILSLIGYPVAMETLNSGRTLGQMAVGSRVVTVEGGPVRFRHSLVRALLAIVDLYFSAGVVAVLVVLVTKRGQRIGDLVAGTMVVRERTADQAAVTQYFQPSMDISGMNAHGVSGELYQTTRDFLGRRFGMTPAARFDLATRLQDLLIPLVGVPPAPGLDPEHYLSSVVAAVQIRDGVAPLPPPTGVPSQGGFTPGAAPPPPQPRTQPSHLPPPQIPAPNVPTPAARPGPPPPPPGQVPSASPPPPPPPADGGFATPG